MSDSAQTSVKVEPRDAISVASQRTYWNVVVDGDVVNSRLAKAKARKCAKGIARKSGGTYECYRVEPGVPVTTSLSKKIDFSNSS